MKLSDSILAICRSVDAPFRLLSIRGFYLLFLSKFQTKDRSQLVGCCQTDVPFTGQESSDHSLCHTCFFCNLVGCLIRIVNSRFQDFRDCLVNFRHVAFPFIQQLNNTQLTSNCQWGISSFLRKNLLLTQNFSEDILCKRNSGATGNRTRLNRILNRHESNLMTPLGNCAEVGPADLDVTIYLPGRFCFWATQLALFSYLIQRSPIKKAACVECSLKYQRVLLYTGRCLVGLDFCVT